MNQIFHSHRMALLFAFLCLTALGWAPLAEAAFYRYTDRNGVVHFTDRLESIPSEYRDQIKEYKEIKQPETPPEKGESKDPGAAERDRQLREAEQKQKEAEAKAAQERAAQEEKLRIRQEKEKQIAELQEKITARQKEQKGLRTNWMVYDRNKLNQLNQEIADLEKQVTTLQKEISEIP